MGLEAGSVWVKLGGLFNRSDFDKWDSALAGAKTSANAPINAKLGADTSDLDKKLTSAGIAVSAFGSLSATADLSVDDKAALAKITSVEALIEKFGNTKASAILGIDNTQALVKYAELDALRIKWSQAKATARFDVDTKQATAALNAIQAQMLAMRKDNPYAELSAATRNAGVRTVNPTQPLPNAPGGTGSRTQWSPWSGLQTTPNSEYSALNWANILKGDGGRGGMFGLPGFGSLGSLAGLGPEHFLMAGGGILASAGTALAGAGVMGAGAGLKMGVAGGANYLVGKETSSATESLYKDQMGYQTAVEQFGPKSQQAATALLALNSQMTTYGKVAGTAEEKTAKMAVNLRNLFDSDTQQAQASKSRIYQGAIGVAQTYAPLIGAADTRNFDLTQQALTPFENWLKSDSGGHSIFNQLESDEAKSIPTTIHAISQAVEFLLKFLTQADNISSQRGGFMDKLNKFFTKENSKSVSDYDTEINKLRADMALWGKTGSLAFDDIKDALKWDGGTSHTLITEVDGFLEQLNRWEKSPAGQQGLTRLFTAHREEFVALLQDLDGLAKGYGAVEIASGPGLVHAMTDIIKLFGDLFKVVGEIPGGNYVIGLGLILAKLHLLGPALRAAKAGVVGLTGAMDSEKVGGFLGSFSKKAAATDAAEGAEDVESGSKGGVLSKIGGLFGGSGQLTGIKGGGIGSATNPLAVVVMAGDQEGLQGRSPKVTEKTGEEVDSEAESAESTAGNAAGDASKAASLADEGGQLSLFDAAAAGGGATTAVKAVEGVEGAAPAVAEDLVPEATGLLSKAAGSLSSIAGNLGLAGGIGIGGTLLSHLAGGIVGGKAGKDVSSIGTDTSLGAAIGTAIEPGIGTAVGAALGGIGGLAKTFLFGSSSPSRTVVEKQSDTVTQNAIVRQGAASQGVDIHTLNASIAGLLKSANELDKRTVTTTHQGASMRGEYGGTFTTQSTVEVKPKISTASGREAIADQQKAGKESAEAYVAGYNSYKFVSEPELFRNFRDMASKLPPWAQAEAAATVEKYANGLASKGDLVGGTVQQLHDEITTKFSDLASILGGDGQNAMQNLTQMLQAQDPEKAATGLIQNLSQLFSNIPADTATTATQMQANWDSMWKSLENDTKDGGANSRAVSKAAMTGLVQDAQKELGDLPTVMSTLSAKGKQNLANNFAQAASAVSDNMTTIGSTTKKGMQLVNQLTNAELKTLGGGNIDMGKAIKGAQNSSSTLNFNSIKATGGLIPGDFGLSDNMMLIDPSGTPVAAMAGDEGIVNRHQMPVINEALAFAQAMGVGAYGNLDEVWSGITRPHGYATGGALPLSVDGATKSSTSSSNSHMTKLLAAANKVSAANFPYHWGGGHEQPAKFEPFDCSGTVSYVTQQAGYKVPTETAQGIGSWGFPHGKGDVTIYYTAGFPGQAAHTFMDIGGRYFGTSGFARPNGGAGWFDQTPSNSYLSKFNTVHLPDLGSASGTGTIAGIKVGGNGADSAISQAAINKAVKQANVKITAANNAAMAGGGGGGDALEGATVSNSAWTSAATQIGKQYGWGSSQITDWAGVEYIEDRNLGLGTTNSSSGAYGLAQFIDGPSEYAKYGGSTGSLTGELKAMASYIKQRYGTPAAALAHEHSAGWYAKGGKLASNIRRFAGGKTVNKKPSISASVSSRNKKAATKQAKKLKSLLGATTSGSNALPGNMQWITKLATQFTADDDKVSQLNNVYTQDNQLYSLYDNSTSNTLPQRDLQTLVGNQESQWNIYMKEIQGKGKSEPGLLTAINMLQSEAKSLIGSPSYKYVYGKGDDVVSDGHVSVLKKNSLTGHHKGSGLDLTLQQINSDSALVTEMSNNLRTDTQKSTVKADKVTATAKKYAEEFRKRTQALVAQQQADANQSLSQTEKIATLTAQLRSATTGSRVTKITNQIQALQESRAGSSQSAALQAQMTKLQNAQQAVASKYSDQGFYTAWATEVSTYNIQSSIDRLKTTIKNLKTLLAQEQKDLEYLIGSGTQVGAVTGGKDNGAKPIYGTATSGGKAVGQTGSGDAAGGLLQDLQYRYYGSPDGTTSSIFDTMETIGYNIVDLVQQGAAVPAKMITEISDLFKSQGVELPVNWSSTASGAAAGQTSAEAWSDFQGFQNSLSQIFQQYGSNFAAAGSRPLSGAGMFAGSQNYGATQGNEVGMSSGATSGTTVNITQNFGGGPSNPLTYASGLRSDIGALV